jgi:thiamine biosynthesis lipoprotein
MGSDAHLVVVGDPYLLDIGRQRVEDLEQRWSRFLPTSEISRLNSRLGTSMRVSADTFQLVSLAVDAWRITGGRFDPTVLGDLIRAGYDRPFEAIAINPHGGVSALRRNCGGIGLDPRTFTVTLPADAGFDPGGIGKGLAADLVSAELLAAGAEGACVNLGGDLRVAGKGPDDGRWVVAIDTGALGLPARLLALATGAVATSAVTNRTWTVGGRRRHHLIDPVHQLAGRDAAMLVTALSGTAAQAEVATKAALFAEVGEELAALADLGCEGVVITEDGSVQQSVGLERFLVAPRGLQPSAS